MFNVSILAMFKNESMIIEEWIQHYIREGVEHFFLIDNGSNDGYEEKIKKYINYLTLVKDPERLKINGTQKKHYNTYFKKLGIKEKTKWLIVVDIDEYIYARENYKNISDILNSYPDEIHKITIPWMIFGSSFHKEQPNSIIQSFTLRKKLDNDKKLGFCKTIVKTKYLCDLNVHDHYLEKFNKRYIGGKDLYENFNYFENNNKTDLLLNHYMVMSEQYFREVKTVRGPGESLLKSSKYTMEFFHKNDKEFNEIKDSRLKDKNYF